MSFISSAICISYSSTAGARSVCLPLFVFQFVGRITQKLLADFHETLGIGRLLITEELI